MDSSSFLKSLSAPTPPEEATVYLRALWYDAQGNRQEAHELIQDLQDKNAAWIHAYLHRKEGDLWNADYWYRHAEKKRPKVPLQEEWEQLVSEFL